MGLTDVHEIGSVLLSGIQEWRSDSKIGLWSVGRDLTACQIKGEKSPL